MTLTDVEIQALQALADKATKGPWHSCYGYGEGFGGVASKTGAMLDFRQPAALSDTVVDANFIAASREATPALCAEVLALRAEVARMREALKPFAEKANHYSNNSNGYACPMLDLSDLRRAREALEGSQ